MVKYINGYLGNLKRLLDVIAVEDIEIVINKFEEAKSEGGRIFVCGNGGSASIANHFACDLGKNVSPDEDKRFNIISICENMASITAYANDNGYENVFSEQLKNYSLTDKDIVFAISSSGNSPNVVKAFEYSATKRCTKISLTGFTGGRLRELSDFGVFVDCGEYEIVEDIHTIILHILVSYFKSREKVEASSCIK